MVAMHKDKVRNNAKRKHGLIIESKQFSRIIIKLERNSIQYIESIIYSYIVEKAPFVQFVICCVFICGCVFKWKVDKLFCLNIVRTGKTKSSFILFP